MGWDIRTINLTWILVWIAVLLLAFTDKDLIDILRISVRYGLIIVGSIIASIFIVSLIEGYYSKRRKQ